MRTIMRKKLITLAALAAFVLVAVFFMTPAKKAPAACGEIFVRADIEWDTTCDF
jgi:hypothetical protein